MHEEEPPQAIKTDEDFQRRFVSMNIFMKRLVDMILKDPSKMGRRQDSGPSSTPPSLATPFPLKIKAKVDISSF